MSQIGQFVSGGGPVVSPVLFLNGNTGGAVGPDGAGVINVIGAGNISVDGNAGLNTETITLVGTTDHAVQIGNASGSLTSIAVGTNGQVLIGATGADPAFATLTSPDSSITFTPGANSLGLAVTGGTSVGKTITGNTGGALAPTAGNWNIVTANSTIVFAGAVSTETLDFNQTNVVLGSSLPSSAGAANNVGMGSAALNATTSATDNVAIGYQAGRLITTGSSSTIVGSQAGFNLTTGTANTAVGNLALASATTGAANAGSNTAIGASTLASLTTGIENDALGRGCGINLVTGSYNTFVGSSAGASFTGSQYTGAESSNILISNVGVLGESNKIRIGTSGSGIGQQNATYIVGIDGVNVGSVAKVVTMASDQLGTATITAGTGITVTPGANTITIASSGTTVLAYTNVNTTPYVVLSTDDWLGVDCSGGPITIQLPNAPTTGRTLIIKDRTGSANTNNITVTTVGGVVNIDGATTYVMNTQYSAIEVLFDGSTYQIA